MQSPIKQQLHPPVTDANAPAPLGCRRLTSRNWPLPCWDGTSARRSAMTQEAPLIYKRTGNLRAVQLLLGHTKLESTVRYLGIEVDDALTISSRRRSERFPRCRVPWPTLSEPLSSLSSQPGTAETRPHLCRSRSRPISAVDRGICAIRGAGPLRQRFASGLNRSRGRWLGDVPEGVK